MFVCFFSSGDSGRVKMICGVTGSGRSPRNPSAADLALAQRDGAQFPGELHDVGKLVEVSGGVGAGGQHKDERDGGRRLLEDRRQVRGLQEEEDREEGEDVEGKKGGKGVTRGGGWRGGGQGEEGELTS